MTSREYKYLRRKNMLKLFFRNNDWDVLLPNDLILIPTGILKDAQGNEVKPVTYKHTRK